MRRTAHTAPDEADHGIDINDRFADQVRESRIAVTAAFLAIDEGRIGEDRHSLQLCVTPHHVQRIEAVQVGHCDVKHDQTGRMVLQPAERIHAAREFLDSELRLQNGAQYQAAVSVIVDNADHTLPPDDPDHDSSTPLDQAHERAI